MKKLLRGLARAAGYDIVRYKAPSESVLPPDIDTRDQAVLEAIGQFTMTSVERQIALIQAVRHLARAGVEGCFVECGVWRGGSSMASALTLVQEQDTNRDLFLFDTYEGMTPPTTADKSVDGTMAQTQLDRGEVWCIAGLDDVQQNMKSTSYPTERVHFVKGPVEETIPAQGPKGPIALLRLDTDWYESTRHELNHLFPLLASGGILIIDDYGHWEGARKAVDEYFGSLSQQYYMHRIDYTGRLLVKG